MRFNLIRKNTLNSDSKIKTITLHSTKIDLSDRYGLEDNYDEEDYDEDDYTVESTTKMEMTYQQFNAYLMKIKRDLGKEIDYLKGDWARGKINLKWTKQ